MRRILSINRFNKIFRFLIILCVFIFLVIYWSKYNDNVILKDEIKFIKKLQNNFGVEEEKLPTKNAICMVLTSEQSITTRGVAVWDTWGQHCEKLLFACSCQNLKKVKEMMEKKENVPDDLKKFEKVANYPILFLNIEENYNRMGEKVMLVLKEVYNMHKSVFQWFYMVDDDTYVFVENLNKFTNSRDSSQAHLYGFKFNIMVPNGYIGGGAGILFTNESMKRLVKNIENKECDKFIDGYGDITIGNCAYSVQISIGDSLDEQKKPRFHPHDPKTHFFGPVPPPLYTAGSHNGKIGKDCCSLETISFHYVSIEDMYAMYANKTFLRDLLL